MKTSTGAWITKFLRYSLLIVALLFMGVYLLIVFLRIRYPFGLEWLEGAMVDHVIRILGDKKLYVSPSLEFVPFTYTPVYFYFSAALSKIIGIGFLPLRLVSFVSSLGCFSFIFLIVKGETGSNYSGVLAASLFSACFRISGAWFDLARVDSLFLLFLLSGLYLIKFRESSKSYILAGVLISLSFLTKQTALIISIPIMIYGVLLNRRSSIYFIGTVALVIGISTYLLNYFNDGWYNYYVFQLLRHHVIIKGMFVDFWTKDILSKLLVAFILSIFYIFAQLTNSNKKNRLFYPLLFLGMVGGAWLPRLYSGSYNNILFPAYAALSILFGLATHRVFGLIPAISANKRKIMETSLYLVCILQFAILTYNPLAQIPTHQDLEAGRAIISTMRQLPGDIFAPSLGYLPTLAGKRSYAHPCAVSDVLRGEDGSVKSRLIRQLSQAIREKRFTALILDSDLPSGVTKSYYTIQGPVFDNPNVFWPVTGMRSRPRYIFVPAP